MLEDFSSSLQGLGIVCRVAGQSVRLSLGQTCGLVGGRAQGQCLLGPLPFRAPEQPNTPMWRRLRSLVWSLFHLLSLQVVLVPTLSNLCSFAVLAGTVVTTVARGGSLHATVSIINIYKEGGLAIQQAGKNMSAKLLVVCRQCPVLRRGERVGARGKWR